MKPKIIIRADGGTSIGMGHVMRCLALADMLKNDFTIAFAIQKPTESVIKNIHSVTETILHLPLADDYNQDANNFSQFLEPNDIVVLDGYNFKTKYQQIIKDKGCKLVVIDDLHSWHHVADAIINHAEGVTVSDYSTENYSKLCLGLDYVLLRKPFLNVTTETKKINTIKKVFISMGAADINNLTHKFTEAVIQVKGIEEIHLMLGSINPNLKSIDALIEKNKSIKIIKHFEISAEELAQLLKVCDVSICPASSISLESCAIGICLVSGYTAENQKGILQGLKDKNAIVDLGDLNAIKSEKIVSEVKKIVESPEKINELIKNQENLIDRKSPLRLLNMFKEMVTEKIHFRFAKESDTDLYYKWSNDTVVRNNSYNQDEITFESHVKWFNSKLQSPACFFYLFLNEENNPIGQVRIDNNGKETVIGISIDENFRGKKLGSILIKMASEDYLKKHASEIIVAYIKQENSASYHSFIKAGFGKEEMVTEKGIKSCKLFKKRDL